MTFGSLFSGIGGMDLGLERAGMECRWQVEIDPFCRKVLTKHWPNVPKYGDIRELTGAELEPVDCIAGGFPCQPVSLAGKRLAQSDERWLWPEFARLIRILRPYTALLENVPGLLSAGMGRVLGDLAEIGYDAEWDCIPASAVGAPHLRYRIFIVAYANSNEHEIGSHAERWPAATDVLADAKGEPERAGLCADESRRERRGRFGDGCSSIAVQDPDRGTVQPRRIWGRTPQADSAGWWATEPNLGRVANGVPARLDRLAGIGNAVVPQVAEWIGRRILEATHES